MSIDGAPVRWGVLGTARIFERRMAPAFAAARNAELIAIASRSEEKAAASAQRHGIPRAFGSYDTLLADDEVEAVYIPLPNDQHREWTLRALEAGKHVLCDKPAALTYADAALMSDTAAAKNLRLMEGFMWRHHPQHARIREIIEGGELGTIVHFRGAFTYPAVRDRNNIRWQAAGGGAFWDVGVYPVNAARFHFGGEPVAVQAVARRDDETGIDLHTVGILEWAEGRTASFVCGFDQAFASTYTVIGDRGSVTAERGFQIGESGVDLTIRIGDSEIRTEHFPHLLQYAREIEDFSACIRDVSLSLTPGEDGRAQAAVTEALARAARERRTVEISEITG
ncbi:MAG: Gfo/Idh/MocA family oxidoreductase [Capsulimonadales bacterium]|nr:Gfo/Idh/MocA family oxidoreductase [Capsulimonadales bacterium]